MKISTPFKSFLLLSQLLLLPAMAGPVDAGNTAGKTDPEWQRVNLETSINERATAIISAYAQGHQFIVQTAITLKPEVKAAKAPVKTGDVAQKTAENEIVLGKLDLNVPMFDQMMTTDDEHGSASSIFARIQKVTVTAYVPKFVLTGAKEQIEKQLKAIAKIASQAQVGVTVEEMIAPKVTAEDDAWNLKRWVVEFKESIGLVLGALVLSFFVLMLGFLVMKSYKTVESKKISVMEARNALEAEKAKAASEVDEGSSGGDGAVADAHTHSAGATSAEEFGEIEGSDSGFVRFKDLLANDPENAASMVRQWVQNPQKNGPFEALVSLPQAIEFKSLSGLFNLLTVEERKGWRTSLGERPMGPTATEAKTADSFISRQIVESLLIPHPVSDVEFKKLLQALTFKDCLGLITEYSDFAPILINFLPTSVVGRIYTLLPKEKADEITLLSVKFKESDVAAKLPQLKEKVREILSGAGLVSGTPFVENISELLKTVSVEKERSIWNALLEAGDETSTRSAAIKIFPAHLVPKLPQAVLKQAIDRFNTAKKADFMSGLPEQDRLFYLEVCGKAGSKTRDMLDYELKQIETNEVRKKRNTKLAPELQREYLTAIRAFVTGDESVRDSATEIVNQWMESATQNGSEQKTA
jgi:hypothetical protein